MKKLSFLLTLLFSFSWSFGQIVNIPDVNFKNALLNTQCASLTSSSVTNVDADLNNDGEIQVSEAIQIQVLDVSTNNIVSLQGISSFFNLRELDCSRNGLSSLALNGFSNLRNLDCSQNSLVNLNLSNLPNLFSLSCSQNSLTSIDLSGLPNLRSLYCVRNSITNLDLSNVPNLVTLYCYENALSVLDLSNVPLLKYIECENNQIGALDISNLNQLEYLDCGSNLLTSLDIANKPALGYLFCYNNQLTSLTFSNVPNLIDFSCSYNLLTSLDAPASDFYEIFLCSHNLLTSLNLTNISEDYWWLDVSYNQLTDLIVPKMPFDGRLNISGNLYSSISFSPNSTIIDFTVNDTNLINLDISSVATTPIDPDPSNYNFRMSDNTNLEYLNVRNGQAQYFNSLYISNNPSLTAVCADESEFPWITATFGTGINLSSTCNLDNQDFAADDFIVTPNPTTGILHILLESGQKVDAIHIYNPLGLLIRTFSSEELSPSLLVDVSTIATGTYFMSIISGQEKIIKKFAKQ